eukprot:4111071-Pyramimonas_sp.AAC.1
MSEARGKLGPIRATSDIIARERHDMCIRLARMRCDGELHRPPALPPLLAKGGRCSEKEAMGGGGGYDCAFMLPNAVA